MLAARIKNRQDHKVRVREEPLLRFRASRFRGARQYAEVLDAGKPPQMLEANPRQARDFILGEELLA